MADPLSVAASVAGLVSLGLSAFQGLMAYCGPYKTFYQDINNLVVRVHLLSQNLRLLQYQFANPSGLNSAFATQYADNVRDNIAACGGGLKELEAILANCREETDPSKKTWEDKFHVKRLKYPFNQDQLKSIYGTVGAMEGLLSLALHTQGIAMLDAQSQDVTFLRKSSVSQATDTQNVLAATLDLQRGQVAMERRLDQRLISIESAFVNYSAHPVWKPAVLRSLLESEKQMSCDMKSLVRMQKRRKGRSSRLCTCTSPPAQPASSSLLSWCITSHSFGCPLYVSEQRVIHLGTRYVICNRLLRFSVNASLNIAYGAGGLSINPQLNFRAVVPDDAPVFKALSDAVKKMHKSPDTAIIDDTTKVILQLFRAGKASPTDSLSDGQTILHVLLRWIHPENPQWDVSLWQRYREMLITLIEAGVSLGSLNDRSESPLDVVLSSICFFGRLEPTNVMSICLCLLQKGALVTPAWAGGIDNQVMKSNWLITILATHCGIEYLDFPEKYLLHVTRSKQDLYAAMAQEKSPELLFRCLEWPMGLYTLIREGYKPSRRVLQTACEYDCEGAVNVLLGERRFNIGRSELTSPKAARQQTTKLIVAALANKRRRLQALAETHLPSETLSQLGIRSDCLMGFNAAAVCARLRANSVSIRRDLMEGKGWLIYNGGWWGCKSADLLWDAGFRNIDETDEQGFTALMHTPQYPESVHQFLPLLIYAQWLVSHGANIYHPRQEAPALHYLAENVGLSLDNDWIFGLCQESYYRESLNHMPAGCVEVVRKILLDEGTDKCCCPCSFNGCSALTRLLAGLYREHKLWNKLELLLWAWETLVRYAFPECERLWHTQSSRVLRYCTFEKMDLTHTCRNHRYRESKDQDDIIDILEAQKESTDLFEALVAEFEAEYNQMGVPLPEFLRSHWLQRMKMVLERQSVPNQEYMDRVREIGVVLEDCQNVE